MQGYQKAASSGLSTSIRYVATGLSGAWVVVLKGNNLDIIVNFGHPIFSVSSLSSCQIPNPLHFHLPLPTIRHPRRGFLAPIRLTSTSHHGNCCLLGTGDMQELRQPFLDLLFLLISPAAHMHMQRETGSWDMPQKRHYRGGRQGHQEQSTVLHSPGRLSGQERHDDDN
jgi:hypothetical protein